MFSNNHTFFKKEREYITQWAKSQISLLFYESCGVTRKHIQSEYLNSLVMLCLCLLVSWTEIWVCCQGEEGGNVTEVTSTFHWASAHGAAPVQSGIHDAFACLLALANKQQVEMSSIHTLNCFSLPVNRSRNRGNWEKVQYISMSSGIYNSWICSRVSKSMEQLLYCCSYIWTNHFVIR